MTGCAANNEPTCGYTGTNEECNRYCNDGTCNSIYPNSLLASTTGNISGIYDMAGLQSYVMGVMLDQNNKPVSGYNSKYNSGFNGTFGCPTCDGDTSGLKELTNGYEWPEEKYYDKYLYSQNNADFNHRILGDATGEMGPLQTINYLGVASTISSWYGDLMAQYFYYLFPISVRGYAPDGGSTSGIFAFQGNYGSPTNVTFRIILTTTQN